MGRIDIEESSGAPSAAAAKRAQKGAAALAATADAASAVSPATAGNGAAAMKSATVKECIKKETFNSDSGYFEGDEEEYEEAEGRVGGGGDVSSASEAEDRLAAREASVEIIFDKNATNNNVGQDGKSHNTGTAYCLL